MVEGTELTRGHVAVAPGPAVLLVNSRSRSGGRGFELSRQLLAAHGVELAHAVAVTRPAALPRFVRGAIEGGAGLLFVGGGDGSLSCAANVILESGRDVVLAPLPLGTGNDFARGLGLPRRLERACAALARGEIRRVDVGRVNGRYFLNAASIGLATAIAKALRPEVKRRFGPLAYPITAARCGVAQQPFIVRLRRGDGPDLELPVLQIVVANGPFHGGGRRVSPEASLDDARLDVYAIVSGARRDRLRLVRGLQLLRLGARLRRGHHVRAKDVLQFRTTTLAVEAFPPQQANVDGEIFTEDALYFDVVPRALSVLAPAG